MIFYDFSIWFKYDFNFNQNTQKFMNFLTKKNANLFWNVWSRLWPGTFLRDFILFLIQHKLDLVPFQIRVAQSVKGIYPPKKTTVWSSSLVRPRDTSLCHVNASRKIPQIRSISFQNEIISPTLSSIRKVKHRAQQVDNTTPIIIKPLGSKSKVPLAPICSRFTCYWIDPVFFSFLRYSTDDGR